MKIPLFLSIMTMLVAPPTVRSADTFMEDFSTFVNGKDDTYTGEDSEGVNQNLNGADADANEWIGRGMYNWQVKSVGSDNRLIIHEKGGGPPTWRPLGKMHDLDLAVTTSVDLMMELPIKSEQTTNWLWLSDEFQNGYGIEYTGRHQKVRILKLWGNTTPFGPHKNTSKWAAPVVDSESVTNAELPLVDPPAETPVTLFLRIEQESNGMPVTLTLWHAAEEAGSSTSYEQPLVQFVDDGSGTIFKSPDGVLSPVLDLTTLTWLGISGSIPKSDGTAEFIKIGAEVVK